MRTCIYCGAEIGISEKMLCEICRDKLMEENDNEPKNETEDIFGSEEAYYRYRNG